MWAGMKAWKVNPHRLFWATMPGVPGMQSKAGTWRRISERLHFVNLQIEPSWLQMRLPQLLLILKKCSTNHWAKLKKQFWHAKFQQGINKKNINKCPYWCVCVFFFNYLSSVKLISNPGLLALPAEHLRRPDQGQLSSTSPDFPCWYSRHLRRCWQPLLFGRYLPKPNGRLEEMHPE